MLAWAACALAVSLALGIAALLAEQACRLRGVPTRGCWLAAMALSLLLPLAAPLLPARVLALPGFAPALHAIAAHDAQGIPARVADGPAPALVIASARGARLAPALPALAAALSATMLCSLILASLRLQRRARGWRRTRIDGLEVLLAPQAGPAVFGWWQPRVVLPEWLGRQATRARSLALAHEREHLRALDPQLLAACLLLLAALPWCVPMWWQLRRLRCAIEVDCDLRVLRAGGDLVDYCETLIALGQHGGAQRGLMAAVPGPQSLLERRIRIMSARPFPWSRSAAVACTALAAAFATCAVAVAAELAPAPPAAPAAPEAPRAALAAHAAMAPRPPAAADAPPPPALPVMAALPAPPAPPAGARSHGPAAIDHVVVDMAATDTGDAEEDSPEAQALEAAKQAAEDAQEHAEEAKADAEEAEQAALEAKRDAEQQAQEAQQAKQAAEAAAAEAAALKRDAENAARALHPAAS